MADATSPEGFPDFIDFVFEFADDHMMVFVL